MTDKPLDGNYWGPGRPARPSNGGEVVITGGGKQDPYDHPTADGSVVTPRPGGSVDKGIFPTDKDPSPRDTRGA
jgi:hypothetical protein